MPATPRASTYADHAPSAVPGPLFSAKLVVVSSVLGFSAFACKHTGSNSRNFTADERLLAAWTDLTTEPDGKTRTLCPGDRKDVDDQVQCAFKDRSTGLVWTSRAPGFDGFREAREYLIWQDARSACEQLGRWAGMDGWRLPTEAELYSAFINKNGDIRHDGFLNIADVRQSFGHVPKYSFLWSISDDVADPSQARALFRGASDVTIGSVSKDMARGWHCVHSTGSIEIGLDQTVPEKDNPPSPGKTTDPRGKRKKALDLPLPSVEPPPGSGKQPSKSELAARSSTQTSIRLSPKQSAISPLTDLNQLAWVYIPIGENTQSASVTPPSKRLFSTAAGSTTDGPDPTKQNHVNSRGAANTTPPQTQSSNDRNSPVSKIQQVFADYELFSTVDQDGNLILNAASGVKFNAGTATLKPTSEVAASKLLKVYTDILSQIYGKNLAKIPVTIVGYTNPRSTNDNPQTERLNIAVSLKRAQLIRKLLINFKIWPADKIKAEGRGEQNPIKRQDQKTGVCGEFDCELSRRVEIRIDLTQLTPET